MKQNLAAFFGAMILCSCSNIDSTEQTKNHEVQNLNDSLTGNQINKDTVSNPSEIEMQKISEQLSVIRKSRLSACLQIWGVNAKEIPELVTKIQNNYLAFDEFDIVEEGEFTAAVSSNNEQVTLTSIIFGPYDGNGRGYSILAIIGDKVYISEAKWGLEETDKIYEIQMSNDKILNVSDTELGIKSAKFGDLKLNRVL